MATLTITAVAFNLVRDNLLGVSAIPVPSITYIAVGNGVQANPSAATGLANEVFRKPLTSSSAGVTGESIFNGLISPTDAVGVAISEVGFFGGLATGVLGSGTLMFYGTYSHTHTSTESLQIQADSTNA